MPSARTGACRTTLLAGVVLLLILAVSPRPAPAAPLVGHPIDSRGSIGATVGLLDPEDAEDGSILAGGRLEIHLLAFLAVGAEASYGSKESYRFEVEGTDLGLEVRTIPITVTARLYAPLPLPILPYVAGGGGWYRQEYRFSPDAVALFQVEDRDETTFGWHGGVGAVLSLAPRIGLFGEYRYIFMDPDAAFDESVQDDIENLEFDSRHILAGISFYF